MGNDFEIKVVCNHIPKLNRSARAQVQKAIRIAASDVEHTAKDLAPVKTGFLRSSITTDLQLDKLLAIVAPHAYYAIFQEYGTSRGVPPHPFMRPAAARERPIFEKLMGSAFKEAGSEAACRETL